MERSRERLLRSASCLRGGGPIAACVIAFAFLAVPVAVRAQELAPPGTGTSSSVAAASNFPGGATFGSGGQWVLTVRSFNEGNTSSSFFFDKQAGGPWTVTLEPALDYFIAGGISVGAVVGFNYASGGFTTVVAGARAGFNQALTERVGFWPTIGVDVRIQNSNGMSNTDVPLTIFAPFLYHAAPHLFLGAGPYFSYRLSPRDATDTHYGLDFVIGGWL